MSKDSAGLKVIFISHSHWTLKITADNNTSANISNNAFFFNYYSDENAVMWIFTFSKQNPQVKKKIKTSWKKKMRNVNFKLNIILLYSIFEGMEQILLAVFTEGTEDIFLCFCGHISTVSTPRFRPLAGAVKQWITEIIPYSYMWNEV